MSLARIYIASPVRFRSFLKKIFTENRDRIRAASRPEDETLRGVAIEGAARNGVRAREEAVTKVGYFFESLYFSFYTFYAIIRRANRLS